MHCTSYCHQGRKPCPCPQACGLPNPTTRAYIVGASTFAASALGLALIFLFTGA